MLTATNITKNYPGAPGVLGGIDLTVPDGQFLAIMGPSGSGKSTLLHILSGMEPPTGGSVHLDGRELTQLAERDLAALRLRHLGFVFQQPRMLQALSLRDNVALPGLLAGRVSRSRVAARADELMSAMGVARVASHLPSQVSGGQLQRAGICRALINEPAVVFADEPTGALNSSTAAQILDLLGQIHAAGTTLVVVTHDAHVAARASRVLVLVDGAIEEDLALGDYDESRAAERLDEVSRALQRQAV